MQQKKQDSLYAQHTPFTISEAKATRKGMKNNRAPGVSGIKKEEFEKATPEVDQIIVDLANKICEEGRWPECFKKQIICPIPKNPQERVAIAEDQTRPISLLELADKWIERMILNRIKNNIKFNISQTGYKYSCDHHTTTLSEHIQTRLQKQNILIFTDIAKAFDSVPRIELQYAIWQSEIPEVFKRVISDFTKERKYQVQINNVDGSYVRSDETRQRYGTPQGSIFGPLLWNLFFDPILEELKSMNNGSGPLSEETVHLLDTLDLAFADDLTLVASSSDPQLAETFLTEKLNQLKKLLEARGMEMSPAKVKVMCISKTEEKHQPNISLEGSKIQLVDEHRFLGVI